MLSWSATSRCTLGDVAQALASRRRRRARATTSTLRRSVMRGDAPPRRPWSTGSSPVDERADHVDAAVAGPVGQGAAQGGGLHLLGGALLVVARRRAVHDATTGELRRAGRALTGAAGALLLVRLAATTADLAAGLGAVRALAGRGELGHDDLVDQRDVDLDVEDLGGQLDRAGGACPRGSARRRSVIVMAPFAAVRTKTRPPLGPGTAPLMRSRPLLGVDRVDGQVLGGLTVAAHAAGHPHALEHATGGGAAADRAGLAVVAVRTVARRRRRGSRDAS